MRILNQKTAAELAELIGMSGSPSRCREKIRRRFQSGQWPATKIGKLWHFDQGQILAVKKGLMTPEQIIARLRTLSVEMVDLGTAMDYYGGFSNIAERGREMVGAGGMAAEWANEWEERLNAPRQ